MLRTPMRGGSLVVTNPDGTTERFGSGEPEIVVRFCTGSLAQFLCDDPLMAFGEAYMNGQVEVEGDLAELVSFAIRNHLASISDVTPRLAGAIRRVASAGARSFRRQKQDVAHHYDIGNDFFRLWLDQSLTYSCAYFRTPGDTLEQAQRQKIDHSLRKLRLHPHEQLLDIGCGWGALVMRAAEVCGAQALGITLSEEQCTAAKAEIQSRGLDGKVAVKLQGYDQLARETAQFDKIVSIGMAEHVGKPHLSEFAHALETLLKPGGLALLHLITGVRNGPVNAWTERYIFPGSYIPTLAETIDCLSDGDFHVWDVENLGPHYRMTLDHWSERFERAVPVIRQKFDDRFVRMWRLYLRASSASFREGIIEVHQILLARGQPRHLGLIREDLYSPEHLDPEREPRN
jgi:cyclopropane-fatty-acyl-phospholipid synthase